MLYSAYARHLQVRRMESIHHTASEYFCMLTDVRLDTIPLIQGFPFCSVRHLQFACVSPALYPICVAAQVPHREARGQPLGSSPVYCTILF